MQEFGSTLQKIDYNFEVGTYLVAEGPAIVERSRSYIERESPREAPAVKL